jgi:hypothetical protein
MSDPRASGDATISVVIPAYNQAPYIAQSVQSVLGQTRGDFELVVVDDGSTDRTPDILAGFRDSRLRVVRQANAGLSAARNAGLRESRAPLVTFLDADDYFLPDKLEVLAAWLDDHPDAGLVVGRARYVDTAGATLRDQETIRARPALPDLLMENPICVSSVLLRRSWLDRAGWFDETLRACEDWDLWLRLLAAGCRMAWLDRPVVAYRFHPGQMTRQSDRMRTALLATLDKFFRAPGLPGDLARQAPAAYASAFVHAAAFAYLSDEADKGARDLAEALARDPALKEDAYRRLTASLVGWSRDPRSAKPAEFLQRIISSPPPGHPGLVRELRRAQADVVLASLFESSREARRARRRDLLRVIALKPAWALNRGVLRMIADAWLPA